MVVGFVWWALARQAREARALESRQAVLQTYTDSVRALVQATRPGAQGLGAVPANPKPAQLRQIGEALPGWISALQEAKVEIGRTVPTPATVSAHELFARSIELYLLSARTMRSALAAPDRMRDDLVGRAADVRDQASQIWIVATRVLDEERARAELGPSGLGFPGAPAAGTAPTTPGAGGG